MGNDNSTSRTSFDDTINTALQKFKKLESEVLKLQATCDLRKLKCEMHVDNNLFKKLERKVVVLENQVRENMLLQRKVDQCNEKFMELEKSYNTLVKKFEKLEGQNKFIELQEKYDMVETKLLAIEGKVCSIEREQYAKGKKNDNSDMNGIVSLEKCESFEYISETVYADDLLCENNPKESTEDQEEIERKPVKLGNQALSYRPHLTSENSQTDSLSILNGENIILLNKLEIENKLFKTSTIIDESKKIYWLVIFGLAANTQPMDVMELLYNCEIKSNCGCQKVETVDGSVLFRLSVCEEWLSKVADLKIWPSSVKIIFESTCSDNKKSNVSFKKNNGILMFYNSAGTQTRTLKGLKT